MFCISLNRKFFKQTTLNSFVFLTIFYLVQSKSLDNSNLRHRRSIDEYESITDPDLLSKQYALVHQFGGVDILGDIRQYKTGKIDTRDFGQNIHYWYKDRIRPGEKEQAVEELTNRGLKALFRIIERVIDENIPVYKL